MFCRVNSLGLFGLNAFKVDVELEASKEMPIFDIIGLPDIVVKESRERIRSALRSSDIAIPNSRIIVNLAPADTKKTGSVTDLAITVALLKMMGIIKADTDNSAYIGEVSLNGDIRGITGVLPMVLMAKKSGIEKVFVPVENAYEASVCDGIEIYPVKSINALLEHYDGINIIETAPEYIAKEEDFVSELDFADVRGQKNAKYALEIAAAGGHNVLLIGSPGSGKNMIAKRMPSILPTMTFEESIEITNIHSISGLIDKEHPLVTKKTFPFTASYYFVGRSCGWR